jgi:hypothetical protein
VIAHRIVASLADPMQLPEARLDGIGVSCGVALLDDPDDIQATLRAADLAMYRAKQDGGGIAVADASGVQRVERIAALVPTQPAPLGARPPLSTPLRSAPSAPGDPETGFAGRPGGPVA